MPATLNLVLASGSRYRRELLTRLRLPFTCDSPEIDEATRPNEAPAELARRLSIEKAQAIATRHPGALIIGSDQVADCDGTVLGKPGSIDVAVSQLQMASGRTVTFWTGLAMHDAVSGTTQQALVRCDVDFRVLNDAEIRRYVDAEMPLDCAGSFKAEGLGVILFRRVTSDDPTSLIGLPLIALCDMLRNAGVSLPPDQ